MEISAPNTFGTHKGVVLTHSLFVALATFLLALLSLSLSSEAHHFTPLWFPTAAAIAVLYRHPPRHWGLPLLASAAPVDHHAGNAAPDHRRQPLDAAFPGRLPGAKQPGAVGLRARAGLLERRRRLEAADRRRRLARRTTLRLILRPLPARGFFFPPPLRQPKRNPNTARRPPEKNGQLLSSAPKIRLQILERITQDTGIPGDICARKPPDR